jgi:hypothetical protein
MSVTIPQGWTVTSPEGQADGPSMTNPTLVGPPAGGATTITTTTDDGLGFPIWINWLPTIGYSLPSFVTPKIPAPTRIPDDDNSPIPTASPGTSDCSDDSCTEGPDCTGTGCIRGEDCIGPNCIRGGDFTGGNCIRGGLCIGDKSEASDCPASLECLPDYWENGGCSADTRRLMGLYDLPGNVTAFSTPVASPSRAVV